MGDKYVEDSTIILPTTIEGGSGLGDLWNCHTSEYIGANLFNTKTFNEDQVIHRPIKTLDYQLIHIKNSEEKIRSVKISASLSIELLSGLIKVEGSANFEKDERKNMNEERLSCQYKLETFSVDLLPNAKEVMDNHVGDMLMDGKIKATHVVRGVILGADIDASITITQLNESSKENIGGSFMGKVIIGPVNATLKAKMDWLDNSDNKDYKLQISVKAKPSLKDQPTTIKSMFTAIENIDEKVKEQKIFKNISDKITGVPIRFILVPINQYLDLKVEKMYKQLRDEVFEKFSTMLLTLRDFGVDGFVNIEVLKKKPPLIMILSDPISPLTKNIAQYQKKLRETAGKYLSEALKKLKKYKVGQLESEALLEVVNNFEKELNVSEVYAHINDFVETGGRDLAGVNQVDMGEAKENIKFLTNQAAITSWFSTERGIKVLLQTKGTSPHGVFRRLYDITPTLSKLGVEIGVAIPSISENFTMSIKINEKSNTYGADKIPFVLTIFSVCIDVASSTEMLFYKIAAELFHQKVPLPAKELANIPGIIDIMEMCQRVYVPRSHIETLVLLKKKDNVWKFFIPLEALNTSYDAVEKVIPMIENLKMDGSNLVVGNLNTLRCEAAPLLIVIRGGIVRAVCMDNLDLLILTKQFAISSNPDLSMLSPDHLINSLYPERARYTAEFLNFFSQPNAKKIDSTLFTLPQFANKPEQNIVDTLKVLHVSLTGDLLDVISTVTSITVKSFPKLTALLKPHGWIEGEEKFANENLMNKTGMELLSDELDDWFELQLPFLASIETAIGSIKEAQDSDMSTDSVEKADARITAIKEDPECPEDLRNKISSMRSPDPKTSLPNIKKAFEEYVNSARKTNDFFHVSALISLITKADPDDKTGQYVHNIVPQFVEQIKISIAQYPDVDKHINNFRKNKQYYQLTRLLAKLTYDHKLYTLHQKIEELSSIDDKGKIADMIGEISKVDLTYNQWKRLWFNIQFEHFIRSGIDDRRVLEAIAKAHGYNIPNFVPDDIRGRLQEITDENDADIKPSSRIGSIDELLTILNRILQRRTVPDEFRVLLSNSVAENEDLRKNLEEAGALYYWDPEENKFYETWGLATISRVIEKLNDWKDAKSKSDLLIL